MKPIVYKVSAAAILLAATAIVPACSTTGSAPSPASVLYAASATLDQTEVAATAYAKSPVADKAAVAEIKALDNTAYNALHPLVDQARAGQSVVTAVEAEAAQAAVSALSSYLVSKGIK